MLISYEVVGHDGKIHLVDSDFEETSHHNHIGDAVVDVYEKRNLNVAANLVRSFLLWSKKYNHDIGTVIARNEAHHKHPKYKEDIDKYLLLM